MFSSFVAAMKGGGGSYLHLVTELLSGFDGSRNEGLQVRSHAEKFLLFVGEKIYNSIMFVFRCVKYLRSIFVPFLKVCASYLHYIKNVVFYSFILQTVNK
jgi:hypothetical protein